MSQDPFVDAAATAARKAGGLAAAAAAVIKLIVDMLREHQQREQAARRPAVQQGPVQQQQDSVRQGTSVHAQVFAGLSEDLARIVTTSPRFGELATVLRQVEAGGVDVAGFLSVLGPGLAREMARRTSEAPQNASTAAAAPAVKENPRLRDRIRELLSGRHQPETTVSLASWMSPDDQAWAVATAVYACGTDAADRLVGSPQWDQIAQDLVTLGHAHRYGYVDTHPAGVLEHAWRALPGSAGVDWPTAATISLAQARDHYARAQTPREGADQMAPDTQPVQVEAEQAEAVQAEAEAVTSAPAQRASGSTTDKAAPDTAPARTAKTARARAAASRPSTVAPGEQIAVGDHAPTATQSTTAGPARSRGRAR